MVSSGLVAVRSSLCRRFFPRSGLSGTGVREDEGQHLQHVYPKAKVYGGSGRFAFDPQADIALAESGCWRWSSDKPELHRAVAEFFVKRREDG